MAMPTNARNQYLKTQVETASKEQLVVMLFDGILRFSEQARKAIEEKQIEESHHALMRAQAIVMELIVTVDREKGGEVASNLTALHAYAFNCLITANMKKDLSKIDEVQNIYRQLREGWVGAMESLGLSGSKNAAASAPVAPKTIPTGPAPRTIPTGAPVAAKTIPTAPAPARTIPAAPVRPQVGPGNNGILAARPAAMPAAAAIPTRAPAVPAHSPVAPAAAPTSAPKPALVGAYGAGRTAMVGAYAAAAQAPAAAAQQSAAAKVVAPVNGNSAAMLSAYQTRARNIA